MEEDGGDGPMEGCSSALNSLGIAGRASLRGERGSGWDSLGWGDGLGTKSTTAAGTESHHVGKGQTNEAGTFVECVGVCGEEVNGGIETFADQR